MAVKIAPEERFEQYVNRTESCWLWTGKTAGSGARYGSFWPGPTDAERVPAHRYAYELWVGPIPSGMEIDHVAARGCTSKLCVNPAHLEPVTHGENRRRGRLTVCRAGLHNLTIPGNMRFDENGNRRGCLPCKLESARRHSAAVYERKKASHGM